MSVLLAILVTIIPGYLLGALPWGLWISRWRGVDIRKKGSGNLGATNVYRQIGPGPGIAVLLLDIGKGIAAVAWGSFGPGAMEFPGGPAMAGLVAGIASIVGHILTLFAGFRGGKGVATTVGVFLALTPIAMGAAIVTFFLVTFLSKRVSAGSLALALVFPSVIFFMEKGPLRVPLLYLGVVITILIFVRHVENIKRLAAGTEPPFSLRGPSKESTGPQRRGKSESSS